jgi:hypothetical protein
MIIIIASSSSYRHHTVIIVMTSAVAVVTTHTDQRRRIRCTAAEWAALIAKDAQLDSNLAAVGLAGAQAGRGGLQLTKVVNGGAGRCLAASHAAAPAHAHARWRHT